MGAPSDKIQANIYDALAEEVSSIFGAVLHQFPPRPMPEERPGSRTNRAELKENVSVPESAPLPRQPSVGVVEDSAATTSSVGGVASVISKSSSSSFLTNARTLQPSGTAPSIMSNAKGSSMNR